MSSLWRHVEHNYREGGLGQVIYKVFWRVGQPLWSQASWLVYSVDLAKYTLQPSLPLVRSELSFDDLLRLGYYKVVSFPEAVRSRLSTGARCHGFFLDGELVNTAWTTSGYLSLEPGVSVSEPGSAGIFDCHTDPRHRSKGIYKETLVQLLLSFREQGVQVGLIGVDPANLPSIKGIERAGFVPLYRLERQRRLGRSILRKAAFQPVLAR